jgi:hypothetical protein
MTILGSVGKQRALVEFPIAELEEYQIISNEMGEMESFIISFWEILFLFKWSCHHRTPIEFHRYPSMVKIVTGNISMILSLLSINSCYYATDENEQVLVESTTTDSDRDGLDGSGDIIIANNDNDERTTRKERHYHALDLDEWF